MHVMQRCNHVENSVATSALVSRIFFPVGDRVDVSENLGATMVVPVTLVDTSLLCIEQIEIDHYRTYIQ